MNSSYRIAIYLRLSKEDKEIHDESNSILNQRILLKEYVRNNFEQYELEEFVDDGFSGTNFRRPGIRKMLDQIRDGRWDCVIVKDFSRFCRDYIELGSYLEQIFPFLGVRFISLNDKYDSRDYVGVCSDLNTSFKGLMYDLYSKDLAIKVKSSLQSRKEQGQYISGNTPFGYMKSPGDRHVLMVAKDEAAVVRRIFSLALDGKSSMEIARFLNQERIKTPIEFKITKKQTSRSPRGSRFQWDHTVICAILKNPVYVGDMVYDKFYRNEVGGKNHLKPRCEWKIHKNHHEAIIPREVFEEIQNNRKGKSDVKEKNNKISHSFQGKVFCGGCRRKMRLRDEGLNPYFNCARIYFYSDTEMCVRKMNLMFLEQYVLYRIVEELQIHENLEKLQEKREADIRKKIGDLEKNKRELLDRKKVLLRKRMEEYEKSVFDKNFKYQKDDMEITKAEEQSCEIEKEIGRFKAELSLKSHRIGEEYRKTEIKITKEFVDKFIHKIIVYDETHIEIEWKFESVKNAVV